MSLTNDMKSWFQAPPTRTTGNFSLTGDFTPRPCSPLEPGWNPVDTTPPPQKSEFLAFFPTGAVYVVRQAWLDAHGKELSPPTHWRPLPR